MKVAWITLRDSVRSFMDDDCFSSGAAIAFYAIFSLPSLFVILWTVAEFAGVSARKINQIAESQAGLPLLSSIQGPAADEKVADEKVADEKVADEKVADEKVADEQARDPNRRQTEKSKAGDEDASRDDRADTNSTSNNAFSRLVGIALLLFSASGVLAQLQYSLNRAWEVEPDPQQGGLKTFFFKRVVSLGLILVIAFLLLISLGLSTLIEFVVRYLQGSAPSGLAKTMSLLMNEVTTFVLAGALFAAMYKFLPDADMKWRDVLIGAGITSALSTVGRLLLSWYLRTANVAEGWDEAARSTVVVLVWVYYSSLIILFGAEVSQVLVNRFGAGSRPSEGAVRVVRKKVHVRDDEASTAVSAD